MEGWLKDGKFEIKLIDGRIQRQIRTKNEWNRSKRFTVGVGNVIYLLHSRFKMSSLKSNDDLFKVVHVKGVQMADSYGNCM